MFRKSNYLVLSPEMEKLILTARREMHKGAFSKEARDNLVAAVRAGNERVLMDGRVMAITYHGDHIHVNPVVGNLPCGTYNYKNMVGAT